MASNSPDQHRSTSPAPFHTVEDHLLAIAKSWAEAIVGGNAARLATFVTDDWVIVSESGISAGARFLGLVASGDLIHSAMDVVGQTRVRVWGDTAVLTARVTNTSHYKGRRTDADDWTTDVFVKQDGRWLCALTHYAAVKPPS